VDAFSGGWRMRLKLARALHVRSDLAAARRTHQPPRPGCGDLAGAMAARLPGHAARDFGTIAIFSTVPSGTSWRSSNAG